MRIFLLFILLSASLFLNLIKFFEARKAKSHLYQEEEFPELNEDEIIRAKQKYLNEQDIDQKGFLEPVVNPEKFDLNSDEKISSFRILIYYFKSNCPTAPKIGSWYCGRPNENGILISFFK